jgi:hypothetical protein
VPDKADVLKPDFSFAVRPGVGGAGFYKTLFEPVEAALGPLDKMTLTAIIGFSAGGPVSLNTIGRGASPVTYVTCELVCYADQRPSSLGPFEVLITSNDEAWARNAATCVGELSLEVVVDHLHSIDLASRVDAPTKLQGVLLERFSSSKIDGESYGILRAIGVTRAELEWCLEHSVAELLQKLKAAGIYPVSDVGRESVDLS